MRFLKWLGAALLSLVVVMTINTVLFSKPLNVISPLLNNSPINEGAVAERLAKGLTFPTISHMDVDKSDPQIFKDFNDYLRESYPLTHEYLELEVVNELSLLYRWKGLDGDRKPLLFMSHLDVVPVDSETRNKWVHDPFGGVISNGIIWGRGAVDIKSGVMGIMEAVESLLGQGFVPQQDIYLAFGHDEEIGGQAGAAQIAQLLKERKLDFKLILDEGGSIVGEGIIPGMDTPVALIGIAEKGYVSLELKTNSVGGHSSMPPKHTALGVIAKALVDLENNPFPSNMIYTKKLFETIGPAMGGINKAVFANMWLTEPLVEHILSGTKTTNATIRTTTAVTMAKGSSKDNILPSEASAVVNFRIMPGEDGETVLARVKDIVDNEDIKITMLGGFSGKPSEVSKSDNESFQLIKESILRVTQDENLIVAPYLVTGGTDAKHYTGLSDSIYRFAFNRFTPDTLDRMHGVNEQIKVSDYIDVVRFFREVMVGANQESDHIAQQ